MENLEQQNLIDGIVGPEESLTGETPEMSDKTVVDENGTPSASPTGKGEDTESGQATGGRFESEMTESFFERMVERSLTRLAHEVSEAEERGFRRGLEAARRQYAKETDNLKSVPNFLADIRPDIWEA